MTEPQEGKYSFPQRYRIDIIDIKSSDPMEILRNRRLLNLKEIEK